ncbi:hypothetical protein F4780DRAFT_792212 [Xylariomycetidae sp. FL0641]|nr:hypothetical protein F4780DRAFT_792212 [Xylariomycetidae sp. FL0641]
MSSLRFAHMLSLIGGLVGLAAAMSQAVDFERHHPSWPSTIKRMVHGSDWPEFVNKTTRWSTYQAPTFNEVFLPETENDLSIGLQYLASIDRAFLTKSGGHGYSATLHSVQEAVLINMENFAYVNMNEDHTVTVGTGATFDKLAKSVGGAGREVTIGSCPCVGAMGAMLGGGLGRFEGLHGLTSDALRSARMVLWNGTVVKASDNSNKDLFWGLRGAGQNFGVVTEGIFETFEATNGGMQYSADLVFTMDKLEHVFDVNNQLLSKGLESHLALVTVVGSDPTSLETLIYKGKAVTALYSKYSSSISEYYVPWVDLANVALPGVFVSGCPPGRRADQYSVLTKTLPTATFREAANAYTEYIQANPGANTSVILIETFAQQGIKALPDDYSAFPHRNAFANAVVFSATYGDDRYAEAANTWAMKWRDIVAQPQVSGYKPLAIYQNYAHGDEPLSALYGPDTWCHERLTAIKRSYDPKGHFNVYHAVPASLGGWH